MKARTWGLIFIVLALLIVSACQSGSGNNSSNGGTSAETGNSEKGEQVTIKFWYPGAGPAEDAVKEVVAAFESKHPNVKIDYSVVQWSEFFQKLSVGYAGGMAPDIHGLGFGQFFYTVMQDQYMNLNDFIEQDQWDGKEDFFQDVLKLGQYEGGQYAFLMPEVRPFVWRKDFFAEAGLDPEKPPQTYEELYEYAKKLTVYDSNGKTTRAGIDIQTQNGEQSYMSMLLLQGGQDMNIYEPNGNPMFDSEVSIDLVKRMTDLVKEGVVIPSHNHQLEGSLFKNSMAAMAFEQQPYVEELVSNIGADKLGFSLPPVGPNGNRTALTLGVFITMNKNTKHPKETWDFMKFFFESENILKFTEKTGFAVPRQSLMEEFIAARPQNQYVFEAMKDAKGYTPSEHWNLNMKYLRLGLEESYSGIRPVEEALKMNAEQVRTELGIKK